MPHIVWKTALLSTFTAKTLATYELLSGCFEDRDQLSIRNRIKGKKLQSIVLKKMALTNYQIYNQWHVLKFSPLAFG